MWVEAWTAYTPDRRRLQVRRDGREWLVQCGEARARSELLDVAVIEAIRSDHDIAADGSGIDYAAWVRSFSDSIERAQEKERPTERPPAASGRRRS